MTSAANKDAAMAEFGKLLASAFDQAIDGLERTYSSIETPEREWDFSAAWILGPLTPRQKTMKIAQIGVEKFIHFLLAYIQDSRSFRIVSRNGEEEEIDVIKASDDILMELRD